MFSTGTSGFAKEKDYNKVYPLDGKHFNICLLLLSGSFLRLPTSPQLLSWQWDDTAKSPLKSVLKITFKAILLNTSNKSFFPFMPFKVAFLFLSTLVDS